MKRLPILLGLLFITVTIRRVAHFAGGDGLAWTFAIGLAISVFASAYLTSFVKTRAPAMVALVFFVGVDGAFNLSETWRWSVASGRWNATLTLWSDQALYLYRLSDTLYGAFPTLAAGVLGWLARYSEALASTGRGDLAHRAKRALGEWLFGASSVARSEVEPEEATLKCKLCDYEGNRFQVSGHMLKHRKNGHVRESEKEHAA